MSEVWRKVGGRSPAEGFLRGKLPIVRPKAGERIAFYPLEDSVSWFRTHFLQNRTRLCFQEECPCRGADPEWEFRWDGWCVSLLTRQRRVVLAHFTQNTFLECEQLRDRNWPLRGSRITLFRKEGVDRGRVSIQLEPSVMAVRNLPTLGINHMDALAYVYFDGKTDPAAVEHLKHLYGLWAPAEGAQVKYPIRPAEEDSYEGEF